MSQEIKTINLGAVNCYLVKTAKGFILIDTGGTTVFDGDLPAIRARLDKALEDAGCKQGNFMLVIITHGDPDHTGNGAYLKKKYGVKIAIHKDDAEMAEFGNMRTRKINSVLVRIIMFFMGFTKAKLKAMNAAFERFKPDILIDENFNLAEYGFDAKIILLPGHTNGSIGILTADGGLFCGDILGVMKKPSVTPLVENADCMKESIKKLGEMEIRTVYPGHGKSFPMELYLKNRR